MKTQKLDSSAFRRAALACAAFAALAVAGCASDYNRYASTSVDMAKAAEATKTARFTALQSLGCSTTFILDDTGKKVTKQEVKCDGETQRFAAFALAVAGMQAKDEAAARIEAPYTMGNAIRDVAGLIVPLANVGAQIYGIQKNAAVAITQSNNSTALGISTNGTFAGIANGGFGALQGVAASAFATASALGARPTNVTNVTGNGNATNGSTADNSTTMTTSTNNCPGASGGNGAPSGGTGNTGNGGTATTGPAGTSGTSGSTGTGGTGTAGAVNCSAGK